ncbi:calcium-binding protein [Aliiroseovarius sp. F47248L]|uniref:calcium-binding protein n=1 Tax=Aliiroseovarius sp. F47248L TaxID=2926420 RepID=UPI001FF50621|nr:calcium-binding protein [Aliiroseovarius sp. F47248L]MCK0138107.1 hypothetical protein [Aliiroseovarius sp. F47248L]
MSISDNPPLLQNLFLPEIPLVSDEHFGINFVADFESIGERPWEKFDEIVTSTGASTLRYPGGSTAEKGFDIANPNATLVHMTDGAERSIMGAYDFARYCADVDVQAIFIVPTASLIDPNRIGTGQGALAEGMERFVREFVLNTLVAAEGNVAKFEIGNEYETYMSARVYGEVVGQLAPIIQSAIDDYQNTQSIGVDWQRPTVAVQVRTYVANEGSSLTDSDLILRAENAFDSIDYGSLGSIDELVTHLYARERDIGFQAAYHDLETRIENAVNIFSAWADHSDRDVEISVSEWAANHREVSFYGLAQVPVMLKMFYEFVQAGVDTLNFWSAQYHGTSLALNNGDLTAAGEIFSYLSANTVGLSPIDLVDEQMEELGNIAFLGPERGVLFLSNLTADELDIANSFQNLSLNYEIDRIGVLDVDITNADGAYRSFDALDYYNEPDLPGTLEWQEPAELNWKDFSETLLPYQTIIIELNAIPLVDDQGSYFSATSTVSIFCGGLGRDGVSYAEASEGVIVDLIKQQGAGGWADGDTYISLEDVEGSQASDSISGNQLDNIIYGLGGDDVIWGQAGNDEIHTGTGNDTVFAGFGNDKIIIKSALGEFFGGDGEDFFECGTGSYLVTGGTGSDTMSFATLEDGVSIWFNTGVVELSLHDEVQFSGVESVVGTRFNDNATVHAGHNTISLLGGDDVLNLYTEAEGFYSLGSGDDLCFSYSDFVTIDAGEGDDTIMSFGSSTIIAGAGDDRIYIKEGSHTIVFGLDDGSDDIFSFDPSEDLLVFEPDLLDELQAGRYEIQQNAASSTVYFENGGDISFHEVAALEISNYFDEMYI